MRACQEFEQALLVIDDLVWLLLCLERNYTRRKKKEIENSFLTYMIWKRNSETGWKPSMFSVHMNYVQILNLYNGS